MAASGNWTLLNEAFAEDFSEDDQTGGSKKERDTLVGSLQGSEPVSASVLDIASGSSALPREPFAEDGKAVEAGQGSLPAENATFSSRQA